MSISINDSYKHNYTAGTISANTLAIIRNYVARIAAFWAVPFVSLPKIKYSRIKS